MSYPELRLEITPLTKKTDNHVYEAIQDTITAIQRWYENDRNCTTERADRALALMTVLYGALVLRRPVELNMDQQYFGIDRTKV